MIIKRHRGFGLAAGVSEQGCWWFATSQSGLLRGRLPRKAGLGRALAAARRAVDRHLDGQPAVQEAGRPGRPEPEGPPTIGEVLGFNRARFTLVLEGRIRPGQP